MRYTPSLTILSQWRRLGAANPMHSKRGKPISGRFIYLYFLNKKIPPPFASLALPHPVTRSTPPPAAVPLLGALPPIPQNNPWPCPHKPKNGRENPRGAVMPSPWDNNGNRGISPWLNLVVPFDLFMPECMMNDFHSPKMMVSNRYKNSGSKSPPRAHFMLFARAKFRLTGRGLWGGSSASYQAAGKYLHPPHVMPLMSVAHRLGPANPGVSFRGPKIRQTPDRGPTTTTKKGGPGQGK